VQTASWSSRGTEDGSADGGAVMGIDGFGFDTQSTDYYCKFISTADATRVAQSTVPAKPGSSKNLICRTPRWPYDASGGTGVTRLYLEKGGITIPYTGTAPAQIFTYTDIWKAISPTQGLSTYASETLVVSGGGFEVGSELYSCQFETTTTIGGSIYRIGVAGTVVSAAVIECITPHWKIIATLTRVKLYKQNCNGARGVAGACSEANVVTNPDSFKEFRFIAGVRSLSFNTALASYAETRILEVYGGGFDSSRSDYSVEWRNGNETMQLNVTSNRTAHYLKVELPQWAYTPNKVAKVRVLAGSIPVANSFDSTLDFVFESSWSTFVDQAPFNEGTSAGGELVTIIGSGFVLNASQTTAGYVAGVGVDDDYACKFTDAKGFFLLSERVPAVSRDKVVCATPAWGQKQVGVKTSVTLVKGEYVYPSPSADFIFLSSWQTLSATSGPVGGHVSLTINGVGFNKSKTFDCKFSYNDDEIYAYTDPVFPVSANQVVFTTPTWPSWKEGRTKLIIYEGGVEMLQIVDGEGELATYEFLPGFTVSQSHLQIQQGGTGMFSFRPDTVPTGTVTVRVISNDSSVVDVSSPYTMDAEGGIEGNTRDVSVRCLHAGVASIALASTGANFGHMYMGQVFVLCRASIQIDKDSASMPRGSIAFLHIKLEPEFFTGEITISVSSSDRQIVTSNTSLLTFNAYAKRVVELHCVGVGRADVSFHVVSFGQNALYKDIQNLIPVYGMPGYVFPVDTINLFPGASVDIEFAPDTPPSLKVDFMVQIRDSTIVRAEEKVSFPAMRTASKKVTVLHLRPGTTKMRLIGRSASLLEQVSIGCSSPDASKCTEKFSEEGCPFAGSNITGGDSNWLSRMQNISSLAGVSDCTPFRGCFRAACCDSSEGKQCISALKDAGCNLYKIVPPLSATEDQSYDFGALPVDIAQTDLLYKTWVDGLDCQPYVPCAWAQCFPGPGNYESVLSQDITVTAYPGFDITPPNSNMHQGQPVQMTIALQTVPSGPVAVRLYVVDKMKQVLSDPCVHVFPQVLVFSPQSTNQSITVQWLKHGRASFLLVADEGSNLYANVSQFFEDIVSSSPGFLFTQVDPKSDKGGLMTRNGIPNVYLKKGQQLEITVKPDFRHEDAINVDIALDGMLNLQRSPNSMHFDNHEADATKLTLSSSNVGESILRLSNPGSPFGTSKLHVLHAGVGYTAGRIGISNYGGSGFSATYKTGVIRWGFYVDPVRGIPMTGTNYSHHGSQNFQINQTSVFKVSVGTCFRSAIPLYAGSDPLQITGHSGVVVKGCTPEMNANISSGKVVDLSFDSTSCLATGITCHVSLNAYDGAGFFGYFTTGMTDLSITSSGADYTCDWACFVSVESLSGLVAVNGHGQLGHAQTCPLADPTCTDGFVASAEVIYGDARNLEAQVKVVAFAAANITADVTVLSQTQTATITVTPLELPTGNVTFAVSASTSLLQVTGFQFTSGSTSLAEAARTFTVTHMGGGSLRAKVSIFGFGQGNFDGFTGSIEMDLLPGFNISAEAVDVQLFPGYSIVRFGPDSPPDKDTEVMLHVSTQFGKDILLDSYGEKLLIVPQTLLMPAGSTEQQDLKIMHGGSGNVKLRNRVSGTAVITFSVNDPDSNYHGIGIDSSTKSISVDVKPGFESNIQDTHMRYLQAYSTFPLTVTLDHATSQAINISAQSSNISIAKITSQATVLAGQAGPVYFYVEHQGLLGEAYVSLKVDTVGGNYDSVTGLNYMRVLAVPGLIVSTNFVHLQFVKRIELVEIGLDTKPDADVIISFSSSDPHVVGVTSSVEFKMLQWTPNTRRTFTVMWHGVGDAYIECVCKSPAGNYNQVYRTDLVKVRSYLPLQVSRTKVRVQKYGSGEFSVGVAQKPQKDTLFTVTSSPVGIVNVSGPYLIGPGTNDTFLVRMTHIHMGSATVRVLASAAGDVYDGAAADVHVSAMPGFVFSTNEILLYSCPRSSECVKTFTISPEIAPTADVRVTITSSDVSIATVSPSVITLPSINGTGKTAPISVTYISSGAVCLSFAATSVGNYDLVSSGGIDVITIPDVVIGNLIITPSNGGKSHGIHDFTPSHPVIYVQKHSFSTFTIEPTVVPKGQAIVIRIINPRPDLVDLTPYIVFEEGDMTPKVVTVTHKAVGDVRVSILGEGGNYDRAKWQDGILVKALPSLRASSGKTILLNQGMSCPNSAGVFVTEKCVNIAYRYPSHFLLEPSDAVVDNEGVLRSIFLNTSVEYAGSLAINTPSVILTGQGNQTITVTHTAIFVDPASPFFGFTKLSIRAYGPNTNYHHVETVIDLVLEFPGFALSTEVLHVQRWKDSTLTGTIPGFARVELLPDEAPDSQTTINFQSTSPYQSGCDKVENFCPVESQEYTESKPNMEIAQRNKLVWYVSDGRASKYIQATHEGGAPSSTEIVPNSPVGDAWPQGAQVVDSDGSSQLCSGPPPVPVCPGYFNAIYSGLVKTIPAIQIINHAGFIAPRTEISVQRQSEGLFEVRLDTIPMGDTTVYFESSDPAIATVQESEYFFKSEDSAKNITVFAVSPGTAFISFRSASGSFDYDGAVALNAIKVLALKGIGLSKLLIYLQAPPTESGKANFTIFPDSALTAVLSVGISSSDTTRVTCTPTVNFQVGPVSPQVVELNHIASGFESTPVMLSFVVTTADPEYSNAKILPMKVIPLGTFVLSHTKIRVQKARTSSMTIAPNVVPDQDVEVFITVANTSVVKATESVKFLAKKMDPVPFTLVHVSAGHTTLSLNAVSISGNYFGAYLIDAVEVEALNGFQAWTRVIGVTEALPDALITDQKLTVQSQPTSHLSFAHFLVTTDLVPDQETSVVVLSSDDTIVTSSSNVTFKAGVREYKPVTVVHGGRSGIANIYFRATSSVSSGNYNGLESGNIKVQAAPGFVFSSSTVNVQTGGVTNITVRPDLEPTDEVVLSLITSDPTVINVTESVVFSVAGGVGPKNTKTISIGYEGIGTAAISFFARGGNFDGVIYSNAIVAASRPGFTISQSEITVPYSGLISVTFQADAVPTTDVLLTVTSSQPAKAAPTVGSFMLKAGTRDIFTLTIKSWCSVSPGNCARAGKALIEFKVESTSGGNYDGVHISNAITVTVSAPVLSISSLSLYVQQYPGFARFSVAPTIPPNTDTIVSFEPLDPAICASTESVLFSQGASNEANTKQITVTHLSVGETFVKVFIREPLDSNYVNIDPVLVYVRTLASLSLSPSTLRLQPLTSTSVTVVPEIEVDSVLNLQLFATDPNVMSVKPSTLTFTPPRNLIGSGVNVALGTRVVMAENFQVFPRRGVGTIVKILNDNLDLVSVDWDNGIKGQEYSVGKGGLFMLALYEDLTQTITLEHIAFGDSFVTIQGHSRDFHYNGLVFQDSVTVHALPSFVCSQSDMVLQYQRSADVNIMPRVAPTSDFSVQVRVVTVGEHVAGETRAPSDIVQVTPLYFEMYRVDGTNEKNQRTLRFFCAKTGSVQIEFEGTGGNYEGSLYHPIQIRCLPGLLINPTAPAILASPDGSNTISIRPNVVPDDRVTIVITANKQGVIHHTRRLYFEPFVQNQVQELVVEHAGNYLDGECILSLKGYGGSFDGVDVPDAIHVRVSRPGLIVPVRTISVQPNSITTFSVYLDTFPSAGTYITATSSDPSRATINSPLLVYDTSEQVFTVTHVSPGATTIHFSLSSNTPGSTYANISLPSSLSVTANALGSGFIVSSSQVSVLQGVSKTITIGPDAVPDSYVSLSVEIEPPGIVSISPSEVNFEQGIASQYAVLQITWSQAGECAINLRSVGGNFHELFLPSIVKISALPALSASPLMVQSRKRINRKLEVSFSPPAVGAVVITGYFVELSVTPAFTEIIFSSHLPADVLSLVTDPLDRGLCYYYRVTAINRAGMGAPGSGPACSEVHDEPSPVRNVQVKTISEEAVLLQWATPADSGNGTPDGVPILNYKIEVRLENGQLYEQVVAPADHRSAVLKVKAGTPYVVNVNAVTSISSSQSQSASLVLEYAGSPLNYDVPLTFAYSATSIVAPVGASSSLLITPVTAPYLDAIVHVASSNEQSASSTLRLVFKKGSVAPQYVIIAHKRKGVTKLTFSPEGGYFKGFETSVVVETITSDS
jgi:hypothetical protein